MATPEGARVKWNLGAYSNAKLDALTQTIQSETDDTKRTALMQEALALHRDDIGHIPLHQQSLALGLRSNVDAALRADNFMFFKWITMRRCSTGRACDRNVVANEQDLGPQR